LDSAVGGILPLGIGVAISPVPIIAVILMLLSKQAKGNGLAFALGWTLGLALVGAIVLVLVSAHNLSSGGGLSTAVSLLELLLGLLLLYVAVGQWRKRPKPGAEPTMPAWMATLDGLTPAKAPGLAALLSGANPKNLSLTLAAALVIARQPAPWPGDPRARRLYRYRQHHGGRPGTLLSRGGRAGRQDAGRLESVADRQQRDGDGCAAPGDRHAAGP
jgi:threonine/homoserine/homoserine lactone efflux protein